jgi:hypothetical protein
MGSTSATHKANRNYQDKGEGHDGESLSVRVARRDDAARDALAIAALRSDEEEEEV